MKRTNRSVRGLSGGVFRSRFFGVVLGIAACLVLGGVGTATAASISWNAPFNIISDGDIDRSAGPIVDAVNATNTAGDIEVTIGGQAINFRQVDFTTLDPGAASQTANSNFFTSGGGDTGNPELNIVLDSHTWSGALWSFELTGLSPGEAYQIQLIGAADLRACCASRTISAADGAGNASGDFSRGGPGSVVGRFTADTDVQLIEIGPGSVDGVDPGISAYVLSLIDDGSIEGDVNRDGVVNLDDFAIIRDNLFTGVSRTEGDLNFSGLVEFGDFRIWKTAFQSAGGAAQSVPEPATWILLLSGCIACGLSAWRRNVR